MPEVSRQPFGYRAARPSIASTLALSSERLRDWLHALIARNRYRWFGKADYCALLTKKQRERLL